MTTYKSHYACFECRKTFKRRLASDVFDGVDKTRPIVPAKCPECGGMMANMGLDFASPKKSDIKTWKHLATLYHVGITFHSCGCSGPGFIPRDQEQLLSQLQQTLELYIDQQNYWARQPVLPKTMKEIKKANGQKGGFLIVNQSNQDSNGHWKRSTDTLDALEAQQYWNQKAKKVEEQIKFVKQGS